MRTLDKDNSVLIIIDVQEKLVNVLDKDVVVKNTMKLAEAAKLLNIPTIVTEQYPKGLGQTVNDVKERLIESVQILEKTSFSAIKHENIFDVVKATNKKQVVICGIETHICVHQTVADLLDAGYEVFVAKDACASRRKYEFKQGIDIMQQNGAKISCLEIILFEWLKSSRDEHFKEVQALIK